MKRRSLKGATGNLYDPESGANSMALGELWSVLDSLGFRVRRKSANERTLRVYPVKLYQYPLLNPRFEATAADLDRTKNFECLVISAYSKGRDAALNRHLRGFPSTDDCSFAPVDSVADRYYCHGHFVIPVRFSGRPGMWQIDFGSLGTALRTIHQHLVRVP